MEVIYNLYGNLHLKCWLLFKTFEQIFFIIKGPLVLWVKLLCYGWLGYKKKLLVLNFHFTMEQFKWVCKVLVNTFLCGVNELPEGCAFLVIQSIHFQYWLRWTNGEQYYFCQHSVWLYFVDFGAEGLIIGKQ